MSVRKFIGRAAPLAVVGLLVLSAYATERPKSLDSTLMSQSRGNSDGSVLSNVRCPAPNPCTVASAACSVCQVNTYTVTLGNGSGGYSYGTAGGTQCGVVKTGTCNALLTCVTNKNFGANCFGTPNPPSTQPN